MNLSDNLALLDRDETTETLQDIINKLSKLLKSIQRERQLRVCLVGKADYQMNKLFMYVSKFSSHNVKFGNPDRIKWDRMVQTLTDLKDWDSRGVPLLLNPLTKDLELEIYPSNIAAFNNRVLQTFSNELTKKIESGCKGFVLPMGVDTELFNPSLRTRPIQTIKRIGVYHQDELTKLLTNYEIEVISREELNTVDCLLLNHRDYLSLDFLEAAALNCPVISVPTLVNSTMSGLHLVNESEDLLQILKLFENLSYLKTYVDTLGQFVRSQMDWNNSILVWDKLFESVDEAVILKPEPKFCKLPDEAAKRAADMMQVPAKLEDGSIYQPQSLMDELD